MTETTPSVVLTTGLFPHTLRRHKRWHYLSAPPACLNNQTCGNKWHGSNQHPQIPPPAPDHEKKLVFTAQQKMEP